MNPSSHRMNPFVQYKLFITVILGLMLLVPVIVTAQEATEEPQVEPVVTEEVVEQPTEVEETVTPTEEGAVTPEATVEETEVAPEPTESTPEPDATATEVEEGTVEATDIPAEATEEVFIEMTEEPTVEVVETEEATNETETVATEEPSVEETPVDLTSISEDFETWTGENWSVMNWSVTQVDDSLALLSNLANATAMAQVMSLDWTSYSVEVDAKVEAGNTLTMNFDVYSLVLASDGRNRLSQNGEVVATSPTVESSEEPSTWHRISIVKSGTGLTVTVDGNPQYTVVSTNSSLGNFVFVATGDQGVAIDNLMMAEIDENETQTVEVISTPTPEVETVDSPEVTEEPDLLAEVTEEPDLLAEATEEPDLLAEATEEPDLLAEATEEPDLLAEATEEPDLLAEATEEPVVSVAEESVEPTYVVTNIITDDFEGDLSAWNTTASIVEVADGNRVLLLTSNGQLAPVSSTASSGVVFAGQANIMSDVETAGSFTVTFSDVYAVEISTTGITVTENGEVVTAVESAQTLNTWFAFSIEATPDGFTVSINETGVAEYAGTLALDGNFAVTSNTSVMLEDITVDSLTVEEVIEPLATTTPEVLTEEAQNRLGGAAGDLIEAFLAGGDDAVAEFLASSSDPQDEMGRVLVDILASSNYDGESLAQLVTDAGGNVTRTYQKSIEAYVDVNVLIAIAGNEGVRFIRDISRAVSTGPTAPVGTKGSDPTWTEAFNLLSIEEWNLAGIDGADVKIGVIDTGFQKADGTLEGNIPCIANPVPVYTPDGSGNLFDSSLPNIVRDHGTQIIEVICDIAPASDVYMFRADSASSLQAAISAARNPSNRMDILLITLDLGANTSAGGGISGSVDANVYGEIEAAKDSGMVVIVAAGNNNQRTLVLEIPANETSATTINLALTDGDKIKFGWNDFGDNGNVVAKFNVALSGGGNSDSANSNDPVLNPLSLTATSDGTSTLTITPSQNTTITTYLQIQISPVVVNGETPNSASENAVKFTNSPTLSGGTLDITSGAGNLGRPADSDSVISVGAICTRPGENPTRWEFSSNGPRFNADGTPLAAGWDTVITQEEAKPTLMSYSFVTTNAGGVAAPEGDPPVNGLLSCTDGLGGTSASAAHVAAMTALLMSNDGNASFANLNEANATSVNTFNAIRDYLQARSVDLPLGANADGFDITYGSGLSILGAPTYDLNDTVNLTAGADLLPANCNGSNTYYVGQANMGNTGLDGSILTPFTSIAAALNATTPQCIIVMPGEYVTPLFVENNYASPLLVTGYNDVSRISTNDVIFWLRGLYISPDGEYDYGSDPNYKANYRRRAGLYFGKNSANVEFSGFTFVAARFFTDTGGNSNTSSPQAVVMNGSTNTTISNSQFGKITLNGVEYPGWNFSDASPLLIISGTEGGRVENNIFNDNTASGSGAGAYPTLAIANSGSQTNPIIVKDNEIYGNSMLSDGLVPEWGAILFADGSNVDIINNAIYENTGETIVKVATNRPNVAYVGPYEATMTRRARIVGNVFLNNSTQTTDLGLPGPLINGRYAPMIYIINNTMISNTMPTGNTNFGQLFGRGNANSLTATGSPPAGWAFWEIHNNLIYNNTYLTLVGDTNLGTGVGCDRIPNDITPPDVLNAFAWDYTRTFNYADDPTFIFRDRGAQNNWIVGNNNTLPSEFGGCQTAIATNKNTPATVAYNNQNIITSDNQPVDARQLINDDSGSAQNGDFQGIDPTSPYTKSDWQYYAIADTYTDINNSNNNEYSDGIDAAKSQWLSDTGGGDAGDPYMDNSDIATDIVDTKRELDVNNWEINWLTGYAYNPGVSPPQGISSTDNSAYTIDIGAFEYSPLQFETNATDGGSGKDYYDTDQDITVNSVVISAFTDTLEEDSGFITFDFATVVTGGFGNLAFTIQEQPNNYGAQCDSRFENTKGLVNQGAGFNEFFDYCPPPNFYTANNVNAPDVDDVIPDYVSFVIKVTDDAGAVATGEIRFTIDPDPNSGANDDADFGDKTVSIGDQLDGGQAYAQDVFEVVTTLGATPSVRLRPYVRFDNFFFSENGNQEFVDSNGKKLIDYLFEYQITAINDAADDILIGESVDGSFTTDPVRSFTLSDSNTGSATITYSVRDGRGQTSTGNTLVIRSISIIPNEGLYDDASFIWNYSDATNAKFYTERSGNNTTDAPDSGDWQAERKLGAINDTLHTTSTLDDTATFRFRGTGFTVFMRGGDATTGQNFSLSIYDDDTAILSPISATQIWTPRASSVINEVTSGNLNCTTQAGIDLIDATLLVNNLSNYTITCNGLTNRKHTVQIANTGGGTLSVDAFSIINGDLNFADAGPIPPGFHDIDNGVLRNAFGGQWIESSNTNYSNGIALNAPAVPNNVSFTITRASGFAIGTTYRNDASSFNICVNNQDQGSTGICTIVEDNIGSAVDGVRIPFFGLDPNFDYTITLTSMDSGFVFDDLVVFNELMLPTANLPLGETDYSDLNLILGEPFGDDWNESSGKQVVDSNRSAIGPFVAFQMDEYIDTIGIKADNAIPVPVCDSKLAKKGLCPPPPPSGFNGLAVCVNRGNRADNNGTNFGNCIIIDTFNKVDSQSNTFNYFDFFDGTVKSGGSQFISNTDGMIIIPESLFDASWGNTDTIVEIFSLYPDTNVEFTSVTLFSNASGLGEGSYTANSPGIDFVQYDSTTGLYSDVEIDDGSGAFNNIELKQCTKFKKGVCQSEITVGTFMGTSGVGNAILFRMKGTGVMPRFTELAGTFARICIQSATSIASTLPADIAAEIQDEVQANGGCQILDLSGSASNSGRYVNGINNTTQYVMIELLPSPTSATPSMNFDGVDIVGGDLAGLNTLTTGQRYETSYINRESDNRFLYGGSWATKADTSGTHSGMTYDETDNAGSSITFKTSGGNVVNVIRDLKTSIAQVCTGKKKKQVCTPGVNGFSNITVCVAPASNPNDRNCTVHSSDGNATQSVLPISLNTNFQTGNYIVSITSSSDGFVIDAVEVFDTSASKMTVGVYQENSNLIFYQNGQTEILKNTSFENSTLLASGNNWDWSVFGGVSATVSTERPFIGSQSAKIDATTANQSIKSEAFDIIQGISYTAVARVYVISGTVEMRSDITGFNAQASKYSDNWELLRYSFTASTTETVQLELAASVNNTTFFVDDVHVYKGGAWGIGSGGLNDGQIVTSSGYGSQATFMFTGTGFTVKLASDTSSGETQICYENGSTQCFTYDDEQPILVNVVCSSKEIDKGSCPTIATPVTNMGHTVVGLASGDYVVTIQQMDNGLRTYAVPPACSVNNYDKGNCAVAGTGNTSLSSPSTVKLDYIQIYNDTPPPVLSAGSYNEDALINNALGMQLFPGNEWEQIFGASGFTNNSYYQVNDSQTAGSLLALKIDNTEAATIVVDINQANADQLLACGNDVDGSVEFNGTGYDLTSGNCALTNQATNQTQVVFNKNNLTPLSGTGGETVFSLQSLTKDKITVDGYQVLYGTTLTEGYYEEIIGYGTSNSILTTSNGDWNLVNDASYSGLNALQTATNNATIDFTFEGTGVSFLMQTPNAGTPNGQVSIEISNTNICSGTCTFAVDTTNIAAIDGAITIAGLPKETYNVTLTANIIPANSEAVIVDAIEIFGDLQELGSLYDDAQTNVNGTPLLTFNSLWVATENDTTGNFLNNTNHSSSQIGASVSFVVSGTTPTEAIVIYDGNPTTASTNVEVCWATSLLVQTCSTVSLNDSSATTRVNAPSPGNYSVSITNQANGEPLVIDAIQVVEQGLMTEGIYEEDFSQFNEATSPVANTNAGNGSVMQLNNGNDVTFTFEGVAFSALIVESSTNFNVCVYDGAEVANECTSGSPQIDDNYTNTGNTVSAVSYGGFHNTAGTDNAEWTVVITNNDASNPLLIDRVDILGNHNELEITDTGVHEAGEPQLRYLPFGSWTEQTSFKNGTPLNGDRFETAIPGAIAYFEFNDNFGSGTVGIEYIRQFRDEFTPPPVCTKFKKGVCTSYQTQPTTVAFADAELSYGEVGNPSPTKTVFNNGTDPEPANPVDVFQFGDSIGGINCTNGCWGMIEYQRTSTSNSLTPLDYIRIYDPASVLTAGIYQENHPNINDSGSAIPTADTNANAGFFDLISGTAGESYFYFTFEGTGLSVRTFEGSNAEDINICIIDYTGGSVPNPTDASTCLRTYNNVQTTNGFVTRTLQGLHHNAQYMAILKMTSDGTTAMGLDQITIYDEQWFTETDLSDATYLNQLAGGSSYPIDFKTRTTDKLVQFLGDWQTVVEQILIGYTNTKKQTGPIYRTEQNDRALETGATALFRTDGASAVTVDIELGDMGSFQICATPMTSSANFEVDITAGATCQTFTQNGRANVSFVFSNNTNPQVVTVELLTDTWMSLYNVALFDVTGDLSAGLYDHSAPGILYDVTFKTIINETMEVDPVDWNTIGGTTTSEQSGTMQVCISEKNGVCKKYTTAPEPAFEGSFSRKVTANIGQGIKYVGSGGTGVDLDNATYYTAVAHVYIDPTTPGGVAMQLISGTQAISEVNGLDLTTTTRGAWQTIRADFFTVNDYDELILQLVATDGQTVFFVDDVTLTTGGQWATATAPLSPDVCTGKSKKQVCVPGSAVFDAYGGNYYQSTTPGASFTFDFAGTGFELGLIGGNPTGDVEVCYSNQVGFANPSCFTYSQDDGTQLAVDTCTKFKKGVCTATVSSVNNTLNIIGRGIVGLANDTWTVRVREVDDGYNLSSSAVSRQVGTETCVKFKKGKCSQTSVTSVFANAIIGLDYLYIFEGTSIVTVPEGSYNEDAQDNSNNDYLATYPQSSWQSFGGTSAFSNKTYLSPTTKSVASTIPGPAALLQIDVEANDDATAVVFQLGGDSSGLAQTLLVCVDETNGKVGWDGTQFSLSDSNNCKLFNNVGAAGQVSVTNDDISALNTVGTHNITITALTSGFFRIDDYQVFDSRALAAGLHQESLPATILNFGPSDLNIASTCDPLSEWCFNKTKTVIQNVCVKFKKSVCTKTELQPVVATPYLGSAAITSNSGATVNFVAYGTGFSIISDVADNGLDFRVCYKLESAGTSFPSIGSSDEAIALSGYDGGGFPVLISEGGVLCENLTTDTDNWDAIMDRPQSSGEQYGFSFYGLPLATYEVQVMVTTPQTQITSDEWFTFDAVNVFSDLSAVLALQPGLTDDTDSKISYEPSVFWDSNATSNTYENTDSTTNNAGAISQFKVNGNTLVLYQTVGDMSPDVQICLLISNENIYCSVEAERQSRLARQVTTFTQQGDMVTAIVCIKFKKGNCTATGPQTVQEVATFTPVVFYGLGEGLTHTIIMENRVQGKTFNMDALRVID